ncbi:hypothetical protein VNO78_10287 [Psophocarpus tetragonolobus]|uniref:Uncharacterized protein n=1 Tax=Psophocarpus tetragonolobus TaxID=3891 RepID=A0AAN9XMU2_PSOTE
MLYTTDRKVLNHSTCSHKLESRNSQIYKTSIAQHKDIIQYSTNCSLSRVQNAAKVTTSNTEKTSKALKNTSDDSSLKY